MEAPLGRNCESSNINRNSCHYIAVMFPPLLKEFVSVCVCVGGGGGGGGGGSLPAMLLVLVIHLYSIYHIHLYLTPSSLKFKFPEEIDFFFQYYQMYFFSS